ncbi:hypothetical protein GCM10010329_34640 [Streptomyces spiroverticillatus]|uniref:Uncharacterized protein n=1 Tax=Streptomyces finlayi TaxID=67296 RepID=A0A919CA84_9ACTN|nr:hypothetical protein [Streptomyces finlayi]GHA08890.1 hypothetical protein GCM10010329_34640 [Streptomyces spiroverticillatus]GHC91732.1 hypothetical protein GCM10010334_27050 [Streptomyces finlayi]
MGGPPGLLAAQLTDRLARREADGIRPREPADLSAGGRLHGPGYAAYRTDDVRATARRRADVRAITGGDRGRPPKGLGPFSATVRGGCPDEGPRPESLDVAE